MTSTIVAELDFGESTITANVTTDGVTHGIASVESQRIISIEHCFGTSLNVDQGATLQRGTDCQLTRLYCEWSKVTMLS